MELNLERNVIILQGFRRLPSALAALAAAPAALAADGAAGMPLRRPRRPTAISTQAPGLSCTLSSTSGPRPPIGEVSTLPVDASVTRWVYRSSLVGGSNYRLCLPSLGPSVHAGHQDFINHYQSPQTGYWASHLLFAPLGRSAALFVRACWHDSSLESPL